jgi:tRNA modification GTPase
MTRFERKKLTRDQLGAQPEIQNLQGFDSLLKDRIHIVSAFDRSDGESLTEILWESLGDLQFENQALVSQARHFENLSRAEVNLKAAEKLVSDQVSPELSALELKEALMRVQETLGKRFDDQIMDRVFKEFCIGK